jgi:hypothetical protein
VFIRNESLWDDYIKILKETTILFSKSDNFRGPRVEIFDLRKNLYIWQLATTVTTVPELHNEERFG